MELLRRLVDAGALASVDKLIDPVLPDAAEAYVLRCEGLTVTISVNPDDDTIDLFEGDRIGPNQKTVAPEPLWSKAMGRPLRWAWLLMNQQGYRDGIQLDWAHPDEPRGTCLQIIAVASALKLHSCPTPARPP